MSLHFPPKGAIRKKLDKGGAAGVLQLMHREENMFQEQECVDGQ